MNRYHGNNGFIIAVKHPAMYSNGTVKPFLYKTRARTKQFSRLATRTRGVMESRLSLKRKRNLEERGVQNSKTGYAV